MKPYYEDALVTLYHGDSREVGNWLQADALVTDPPYGVRFRPRYVADGSRTQGNRDRHEDRIIGDGDTSIRDEILTRWGDRPWVVFGSWRRPLDKAHTRLTWEKGIQALQVVGGAMIKSSINVRVDSNDDAHGGVHVRSGIVCVEEDIPRSFAEDLPDMDGARALWLYESYDYGTTSSGTMYGRVLSDAVAPAA